MASKFLSFLKRARDIVNEYVPSSVYLALLFHPYEIAVFFMHMKAGLEHDTNAGYPFHYFKYFISHFYLPLENLKIISADDSLQHLQSIYNETGWAGLYCGIHFKAAEMLIMYSIANMAWKYLSGQSADLPEETRLWEEISYNGLQVVLTQPLRNIMLHSFFSLLEKRNDSTVKLIQHVHANFGYKGFYQGLSARLSAEAFFIISCLAISRLLNLRKRNASSVKESVLMMFRDFASRRISCPLEVIYLRMAVLGMGWNWPPTALSTCCGIEI